MYKKFQSYGILFFTVLSMIFTVSCGDDDGGGGSNDILGCTNSTADNYNPNATQDNGSCVISGCTDSRAENYNSSANQDDGNCVFPNEKFIGNYLGSFSCAGLFAVINQDTVLFEISEPVDPEEKSKVTVSFVVTGLPISLEANVSGNDLTFEDITLNNIPLDVGGIMVEATILFSGGAVLDGDLITATLNVSAEAAGLNLVDVCVLVGQKQP